MTSATAAAIRRGNMYIGACLSRLPTKPFPSTTAQVFTDNNTMPNWTQAQVLDFAKLQILPEDAAGRTKGG